MKFPYKIIDLTHTLNSSVPSWEGGCGFSYEKRIDYDDCTTDVKFCVHHINMFAGIGTHMDAPLHCFPNTPSIAELDINTFAAPCVVIDVSDKMEARLVVEPEDILAHEEIHGKIEKNCFVIIRTGWDQFWLTPEKYRNNLLFPCIAWKTALLLLERGIVGLGVDTLSPDRPNQGFPVHEAILGAGKYIVENIANAAQLPSIGSFCIALPLKIEGGTEAPIRLIGLLHSSCQDTRMASKTEIQAC